MGVTMALPISFFLVLGKGWWEWQCLSFCSESKGGGHRPHLGFGHFPLPPLLGKVGLSFPPRYQDKKQDSIGEEVGKAKTFPFSPHPPIPEREREHIWNKRG